MPMAQAADASKSITGTIAISKNSGASVSNNEFTGGTSPLSNVKGSGFATAQTGAQYYVSALNIGGSGDTYNGAIGVYISYFMIASQASSFASTDFVQGFKGVYTNHEGNTGNVSVDVDAFTPSNSLAVSKGHSLKTKFVGTEDLPISYLRLHNSTTSGITRSLLNNNQRAVYVYFTSARIVSTEYSAELGAMESMADELAQQSEMMQAMYGEIIALCNAIYQKCGDLETAINMTNSYCSAMLDALGDIATATNNIYELLGTQFALLISTIQTESSNIQDAIAQAEAKLEAYFDAVGSGAVGTLPEETEDVEDKADSLIEDESAYESDASEQFADIVASFNGFSGGALNGVALATDLFTQIWNVLGEWKVVYTFPLIMGLVLLVIGRMSRFSGTMNSRNNGDKDVGGD